MNETVAFRSRKERKQPTGCLRNMKDEKNMKFGIPEPVRKTLYDVVLENLEISNRKTYLHRLIIAGEHSFKDDQILHLFCESVDKTNENFHYENLTGILLYYARHFIQMIEADETTIYRYLTYLLNNRLYNKLGKAKVLMHTSHIKDRLFPDFVTYFGVPSKILGDIKWEETPQESGRHLYLFLRKFYNFVKVFHDDYYQPDKTSTSPTPTENDQEFAESIYGYSHILSPSQSSIALSSSAMGTMRDPYRVTLPEVELLNYLLKNECQQTLTEYHGIFGEVPQRDIYKDKVWPAPSDLMPFDIFQTPLNILMRLPQVQIKDEEREGFTESGQKENNPGLEIDNGRKSSYAN